MGKMWAGRFSKEADSRVNDFNSSISFDCRMYKQDIQGSIAHVTMLGECGIIDKEESLSIANELGNIFQEIHGGELAFDRLFPHRFVSLPHPSRFGSQQACRAS